jgi:hypothetical protein
MEADHPYLQQGTYLLGENELRRSGSATGTDTDGEAQTMDQQNGPKTRQAGATDLGSAQPDDPVFSEGWMITTGLFGRQSKTPSSSMPQEKPDNQQDKPS